MPKPRSVRQGAALILGLLVLATSPSQGAAPDAKLASEAPDPATIRRYGPAYRYPRAGWIVVHVEGAPYERGYQHGRLLAEEISDYIKTLAGKRSPSDPDAAWRAARTATNALFLRRYDPELLEEMKGTADGAAAAGAKFEGRPIDFLDIVTVNSEIELDFLEDALEATPTGLEGKVFREPPDGTPSTPAPEHCSAFVANGPATADGKIVMGHITMFSLYFVRHFNVWLDIKPEKGHRVLMQTYPGGVQSGMDYYMNDAGLIVAETTIRQTGFNVDGQPLASRIRRALQTADSIDGVVAILKQGNNGLYTNEWLLADTKSNEIAMFELGTHKSKLWRSSRDEWFGGTTGFYWGCNNPKDREVRLETVASPAGKPSNLVYRPSDRDRMWLKLYDAHRGKIDESFGFKAFTTPPLSAFSSLDAKFTTTERANRLETWAVFGPPLGRTWDPAPADLKRFPGCQPLVSNDWTLLRADAVPAAAPVVVEHAELEGGKERDPALARVSLKGQPSSTRRGTVPVDFPEANAPPAPADLSGAPHPPAWHGTVLPASDADTWLAAGFADYESIVARENANQARARAAGRPVTRAERDALALARFAAYSRYRTAVARSGHEAPLNETKSDLRDDAWYQVAAGKGTLLLDALRHEIGDRPFVTLMDRFGREHAGKPVSTAEFRDAAIAAAPSGTRDLNPWFDRWLTQTGLPREPEGGFWSVDTFEADLDRTLIVYGTLREADAQREAAQRLQRFIQRKWSNVAVPILSDRDASPSELEGKHLLLVGRPASNTVTARLVSQLPVRFEAGSFVLRGETYGHPLTSLIVAGPKPGDPRSEIVVFAGLSAEATWRCVEQVGSRDAGPAEAIVSAAGREPQRLVVEPASK
ncbi:MAG: C45 family autoproteolytic acyltransferase/hydrolase [Isosphaeraceae bacterium]